MVAIGTSGGNKIKDQIKQTFNQLAKVYEKSIDTKSLYNSEYERPAMMSQLPDSLHHKNVLDAGCAAGWYTEQLLGRGANVVAMDISPEMVRTTKRRVGESAEVICQDLETKLPFADNSFDYIISSLTLHYMENWDHPFREFKRILKPNGILLFSVHHIFTDLKLRQDYHYFSTEQLTDEWNKEGKTYTVPFYRRPLQAIINKTIQYFSLQEIIEPQPTMNMKDQAPRVYENLMKSPQFLIIKSGKQ
ncbi:ubiquinone biosynthesis methyltransferase UbiE [Ornithinibacillus bavariensis]|uniref:Ubiquinone biosynthesis methyltransferase UbiE n=1 Tax=Ornithinibacillus bavariensis TaxID=545502 RepID=A0A919XC14_9BACI|nr:ubiquinone biosynthesis methyltransferase UbiE [Ornithinibacillus bavariensis]